MLTIVVDAMGGDLGPRVAFRACKAVLKKNPDIRILLPLHPEFHSLAAKTIGRFGSQVEITTCGEHVRMEDSPRVALKDRTDSSMSVALRLHAEGKAESVLSIGNTGALLVMARKILGTMPGVERPSLATQLPTKGKPLLMMDLGANISMTSDQLLQLACLAIAWYRAGGISDPKLALLNIGAEPGKGTDTVRAAGEMFCRELGDSYVGFREGDHLFDGDLDAIICDGYSGNITLKTTEGLIEWLIAMMGNELRNSLALRWFIPLWKATMRRIDRQVSPARHGGAMLLGVAGNVAKTHGKSDERAFRYALEYTVRQARQRNYKALEAELNVQLSRIGR
ncbi:MAG: hypothetical protein VW258_06475 [Thalassolituus sp.]